MRERSGRYSAARLALILTLMLGAMPDAGAEANQQQRRSRAARAAARRAQAEQKAEDASTSADESSTPAPRPGGLRMSRAVVCTDIDGYEKYKPLPGAAQTSDEKLLIYFRPLRYKIDYDEGLYRAHLVQDNEIRKRGRKEIVRQKPKVVEYAPKSKDPLGPIFIRNTISLKGLAPGEYDLTIILRDERDKGSPPSRQVVKFKVIPPHDTRTNAAPASKEEAPPAEDPPSSPES